MSWCRAENLKKRDDGVLAGNNCTIRKKGRGSEKEKVSGEEREKERQNRPL